MAAVSCRSDDTSTSCASRLDHVSYYTSTGLNGRLSRFMYQAQRAQDKGNIDQALAFYYTVLAEDPSCTEAMENKMVLMQASQLVLQQALREAAELAAEQAAAEQAAAEQAAAEAAAEQAAAEQAAAEAAAEQAAAAHADAAAQAAAAKLQAMLEGLQNVVLQDAHIADDGTLVCRSTYNANHVGAGWSEKDVYASAAGNQFNRRQALPHQERFRCWTCDGFGHMRAACPN